MRGDDCLDFLDYAGGTAPIRVMRAVGVAADTAGGVDVPGVAAKATIRGRQAHKLRR